MSDFPLKQPSPGRSKYANEHPLAPNPSAGPQNDPFGGMAHFGDEGTERGSSAAFDSAEISARHAVRQTQVQSRGGVTPEQTTGIHKDGGYVISPAVSSRD